MYCFYKSECKKRERKWVIICPNLSYQSCVLEKREKLRKNENKIYCRYYVSAECLPTELPLPNLVISKTVYGTSHTQEFTWVSFAMQENNISSLTQIAGKKVFSVISPRTTAAL